MPSASHARHSRSAKTESPQRTPAMSIRIRSLLSRECEYTLYYSPNHAAHVALRFLVEWPAFEIVSFQDRDAGKGKTLDRNVVSYNLFYSTENIVSMRTSFLSSICISVL
jgi:hypothetical protein